MHDSRFNAMSTLGMQASLEAMTSLRNTTTLLGEAWKQRRNKT